MANLKEVRIRIGSVKSTQQITKAMKVVSAAKLRKAQQRIVQMRPYAEKLQYMLGQLADSLDGSDAQKWYQVRTPKKVLVVVITSDRGLAGGFNSAIIKETTKQVREKYKSNSIEVDFFTIGKKAKDGIKRDKSNNIFQSDDVIFSNLNYDDANVIVNQIMELFLKGTYDAVDVVYNKFKNAAIYFTTFERFLPIAPAEKTDVKSSASNSKMMTNYIFEPSKEEILSQLIEMSLRTNFFRYLLDSNAAEHGARMTAMDKATDNAEELIKALKLQYNKERQAVITKEILEIVGGAQALNS